MPEVLILEAGRAERNYWRDLWRYRELFYVLAWRDLSVRYKQTVIGAAWAVIRPVLTMVVFTVIFGRIAKLPSDGSAPYPLMVFAGMLPWTFFSTGLSEASSSLIGNANLISKVYFPRLIVPTATVVVAFADFLITFLHPARDDGVVPVRAGLADPRCCRASCCSRSSPASAPALWLTALNVKYRDFRYVIPFIVQFGLYVSPVGFSSSVVPAEWRLLYSLNPMVGVIDGFRWCILGGQSSPIYLPGSRGEPCRRGVFPVVRHSPLPQDGKKLCRSDLSDDKAADTCQTLIISVENLSKRYLVGHRGATRNGQASYTALRDVIGQELRNFGRKAGDLAARPADRAGRHDRGILGAQEMSTSRSRRARFGIIGRNGAGKSTLLKILSPHHRADRGPRHLARPRREPARSRHRISSRTDRAREHLPQRRDPRHDPRARSAKSSTRSSRSPRSRGFSIRR